MIGAAGGGRAGELLRKRIRDLPRGEIRAETTFTADPRDTVEEQENSVLRRTHLTKKLNIEFTLNP